MSTRLLTLSVTASLMGGTALAEVPSVAADIAPVHSLVARVMEGVGAPNLIVQPGASPHEYGMRPSEASALQEADLVVWMGADLTPWMAGAVETLSANASVVTLLEADETNLLEFREGALFEAHDHGEDELTDGEEHGRDEHGDDDHGHEDHAEAKDHGPDDHAEDEEHGQEEHAESDDHGDHDPHAWLSPKNARAWLNLIAARLSAADPDNAGAYFDNAEAARAEIEVLSAEINATLEPVRGGSFIVFHDAYQYFEADFDFPTSGAISFGDASDPSPARIAEIQERIRDEGVDCVLAEPQYNEDLVATVLDGTEANTGVIDPLGAELEPGPALYPQLIRNMSTTLAECL